QLELEALALEAGAYDRVGEADRDGDDAFATEQPELPRARPRPRRRQRGGEPEAAPRDPRAALRGVGVEAAAAVQHVASAAAEPCAVARAAPELTQRDRPRGRRLAVPEARGAERRAELGQPQRRAGQQPGCADPALRGGLAARRQRTDAAGGEREPRVAGLQVIRERQRGLVEDVRLRDPRDAEVERG